MKRILIFMAVGALLLVCVFTSAFAEEPLDYEALFRDMDMEELEEVSALSQKILNEKKVANAKLFLEASQTDIPVGNYAKLTVTCDGREITPQTVITYSSSDEAIAFADRGAVAARSVGPVTVTATAVFEDGGTLTASVDLNIIIPVSYINVTARPSVFVGATTDVQSVIAIYPENATEKGLLFSVDNEEIATIDENGILTGKAKGVVNVTATSVEKVPYPRAVTIPVTVNQAVEGIELNTARFELAKGNSFQLQAVVLPETASNKNVTWESENPQVANVGWGGAVYGTGTGTTKIKCIAADGSEVFAETEVTVIQAVTGLRADKADNIIKVGLTWRPTITVLPNDATQKKLVWTSSDNSVAEVNNAGTITAKKAGDCIITAKATDGSEKSVSIRIKVENLLKAKEAYTLAQRLEADSVQKNGRLVDCSVTYKPNDRFSISYELFQSKGYNNHSYSTYVNMSFNDAKTKGDVKPYFSLKFYALYGEEPNTVSLTIGGNAFTIPSSMWSWHYGDLIIDFSSHRDWLEQLVQYGGAVVWANLNPSSICAVDFSRYSPEHNALVEVWNVWKTAGLYDLFK